jgi:hypothetical protein
MEKATEQWTRTNLRVCGYYFTPSIIQFSQQFAEVFYETIEWMVFVLNEGLCLSNSVRFKYEVNYSIVTRLMLQNEKFPNTKACASHNY